MTAPIRDTVSACAGAGGGRVVVPEGGFLTGAIHLRRGLNLHLSEGAVLLFQTDPKACLPAAYTRWEGMECMGYSLLIYAFNQRNIAITGKGVLDGQAAPTHWWPWKGQKQHGWKQGDPAQGPARNRLMNMIERDVPAADRIVAEGSMLRPQFIQPYRCANVLMEGVTILNSPM